MTSSKKEWIFLGKGSYNKAYINSSKTEILKIQLNSTETDSPERSVRLWNTINADKGLPPARIDKKSNGWICPFVAGEQANDPEIRGALIEIFNQTGRIVVDAISPKNFIRTDKKVIVCVDVGLAVQLEQSDENQFIQRRKSIISLDAWNANKELYAPYFKDNYKKKPQTIDTIKALLFIKENHPQTCDVSFLKNNLSLTQKLANAYFFSNQSLEQKNALKELKAAVDEQKSQVKINEVAEHYNTKLTIVNTIKSSTLNSPNLSTEEKKFINRVCNTLTTKITEHRDAFLENRNKSIADMEAKKQKTNQFIKQYLDEISGEVKAIPILSGLKGFINSICVAFNFKPPYIIADSENIKTLEEMKKTLSEIKAEPIEKAYSIRPTAQ